MAARSRAISPRRLIRPLSLAGIVTALLSPGLVIGPSLDAAIFLLTGMRVHSGGMPYRDVWDHKPPGIYILHGVAETLVPFVSPWHLAWLLSAGSTIAAILVFDWILRQRASYRWSWIWSAVTAVLVSSYPAAIGGGMTETFALLPVVGVMAIVAQSPVSVGRAASAGLLLATACLFSAFAIPAAVALGIAIAMPSRRDLRPALVRLVAFALAGTCVAAVVVAWLAAGGALQDGIDQLVSYTGSYRASSRNFGTTFFESAGQYVFALPVIAVGLPRAIGRARRGDRLIGTVPIWLVLFAAMVLYDGRQYSHYNVLVAPAIALLGIEAIGWLAALPPTTKLWARVRLATIAAGPGSLFLASLAFIVWLSVLRMSQGANGAAAVRETGDALQSMTPPSAAIFVWGDDPTVYLASDRAPATRYVYQLPMVTPGYWTPERTAEVLAAWRVDPPAAIVANQGGVPLDPKPGWTAPTNGDARFYDTFDPLREFVRANYRLVFEGRKLEVYLLARP